MISLECTHEIIDQSFVKWQSVNDVMKALEKINDIGLKAAM